MAKNKCLVPIKKIKQAMIFMDDKFKGAQKDIAFVELIVYQALEGVFEKFNFDNSQIDSLMAELLQLWQDCTWCEPFNNITNLTTLVVKIVNENIEEFLNDFIIEHDEMIPSLIASDGYDWMMDFVFQEIFDEVDMQILEICEPEEDELNTIIVE